MLRIAVVEDDIRYCQEYATFVRRYAEEKGKAIQISEFHDGDEILRNYRPEYDLILMDIDMKFLNGMSAAKEIRKIDSQVIIIFMTNMPQYAMEGYKVDALDYVLKPINYYDFSQRLDRAFSRLQKRQNQHFLIAVRGGVQRIDVRRLMYVEVRDHDLIYHTLDEKIETRGTIRDVESKLESQGFFRCHKCYLINLAFVESLKGGDVQVGRDLIQVSRSHRKDLLNALNDYMDEI